VRYRNNSLFYKNQHGACVGDVLSSLIETCRLNGINPIDDLSALLNNRSAVFANPADGLPWTFQDAPAASAQAPPLGHLPPIEHAALRSQLQHHPTPRKRSSTAPESIPSPGSMRSRSPSGRISSRQPGVNCRRCACTTTSGASTTNVAGRLGMPCPSSTADGQTAPFVQIPTAEAQPARDLRQPIVFHQGDCLRPQLIGNPLPLLLLPAPMLEMLGDLFQGQCLGWLGVDSETGSLFIGSPVIALHRPHPIQPAVKRSRTLAGTTPTRPMVCAIAAAGVFRIVQHIG
jgi:hypothetical protein